jgi:ABC-2 type transport system ATP-binding protein
MEHMDMASFTELLDRGKEYTAQLDLFFRSLDQQFEQMPFPRPLKQMAKSGFESASGKSPPRWVEFAAEMETTLSRWSKREGQPEAVDLSLTVNRWRSALAKLAICLQQAPVQAQGIWKKTSSGGGNDENSENLENPGLATVRNLLAWLDNWKGLSPGAPETDGLRPSLGWDGVLENGGTLALEITGVRKKYKDIEAVKGVSLAIRRGEIFGLLGPNGAGKTTLIECIEGIRRADAGRVQLLGQKYTGAEKEVKERIGVQLQDCGYYETLTVKEILNMYASFFKTRCETQALLERLDLTGKQHTMVKHLSGGQLQRLALAATLVNDPELIFLDEPTSGLDPHARRSLWHIIRELQEQGKTVFLTTHYMEEAEFLCNRVAIMHEGRFIEMDSPQNLINRHTGEKTIDVYVNGPVDEAELQGIPAVKRFWLKDSRVIITSDDYKTTMAHLLEWQPGNASVEDITVRRGNLEDVFLKLTDRGLA